MDKTMYLIKKGYGLPPLIGNKIPMPQVQSVKSSKKKMNFDRYYKLNEADVKDILADYFDVCSCNVSIKIVPVSVGYGSIEHEENHIEVTVKEDKI